MAQFKQSTIKIMVMHKICTKSAQPVHNLHNLYTRQTTFTLVTFMPGCMWDLSGNIIVNVDPAIGGLSLTPRVLLSNENAPTHTHIDLRAHVLTSSVHTHKSTHVHKYTQAHVHIYPHTYTHTHIHKQNTHNHTRARARKYTLLCTQVPLCVLISLEYLSFFYLWPITVSVSRYPGLFCEDYFVLDFDANEA